MPRYMGLAVTTSSWREPALIAAALALVVVVAYAAPLLGGATFVGRDHLIHTLPGKQVIADAIRSGYLPEWWNGVDLGVPFAANPNHSALYPPVWLVALLPMPWSADFVLVLHVLVAGLGTTALSRRFGASPLGAMIGGAAFMLTGFTTSTVVHGGPLLTLAWMPWVLWAGDRLVAAQERRERVRRTLGLTALLGAQLLAGDPSIVIMSGLLLLAVLVCRAPQRRPALLSAAVAVVGAVLLAAIMLLPALSLARSSTRGSGIEEGLATAWSMHPLRVLEWVWPSVYGDSNEPAEHLARVVANAAGPTPLAPSWALSLYVSMPIVGLAIIGWARSRRDLRLLGIAAIVFVLLALGRYTPIYGLYRTVFLPERFVRYPEKYVGGAILLACAMAGIGWTCVAARGLSRRGAVALAVILGVFAVGVAGVAIGAAPLADAISRARTEQAPPLDGQATISGITRNGLAALTITCVVLAALYAAQRKALRRVAVPIGAVALIGHLITLNWQVLPTFDRSIVERQPRVLEAADPAQGRRLYRSEQLLVAEHETAAERMVTIYDSALANTATRFGFEYLRGYDQASSALFQQSWNRFLASAGDRALDMYGVDLQVVLSPADASYQLLRNQDTRPRAFVASRWRWFATHDQLFAELFPPGLTHADRTLLDTVHLVGAGQDKLDGGALTPCSTEAAHPELVRITCDSNGGYAVLLDAWADGWSAHVDGAPARIERADALARAVMVPPGRHTIVLRYRAPGLRTGAIVSIVAWIALLALWIAMRKRRTDADVNDPHAAGPAGSSA